MKLFLISCVLHGLEYDKRRYKGIVHLVCLSALIIISAQFGYKHYNPVREPREMINVHIIMQGVMGLLYAIAYNISQTYAFKSLMKKRLSTLQPLSLSNALCFSHITGLLTAISVHLITNLLMELLKN